MGNAVYAEKNMIQDGFSGLAKGAAFAFVLTAAAAQVSEAQTYNVTAANNYALLWSDPNKSGGPWNPAYFIYEDNSKCTWWNKPVTNPPTPETKSWCTGDCSNFVSQALKAGGLTLSPATDSKGVIAGVEGLGVYIRTKFLNNVSSRWAINVKSPGMPTGFKVKVGDVIQFGSASSVPGEGPWMHSAFVCRVDNPNLMSGIYLCQHQDAKKETPLDLKMGAFNLFHYYSMTTGGGDIGDRVDITESPSQINVFHSSTFRAQFVDVNNSGSFTDRWDWTIDLIHATGSYRLASVNGLTGRNTISWTPSIPGLPAGYSWTLAPNGNIQAVATVTTVDSDGARHSRQTSVELGVKGPSFTVSSSTAGRPNTFDVGGLDGADRPFLVRLSDASVLEITTCASGTYYDTQVEVFTLDMTSTGQYNDDAGSLCSMNGNYSTIPSAPLPKGYYYIVVDGWNGANGLFNLQVKHSVAASNIIAGQPFYHLGNTSGKPNAWDVQGTDGADVEYHLSLPHSAALDLSTCRSNTTYDTKLEIFNAGTRATTGFYNDDATCASAAGLASTLSAARLPAGEYKVVVDGYNGAVGGYGVSVRHFADFTVPGIPYSNSSSNTGKFDDWDVSGTDGQDVAYLVDVQMPTALRFSTCNATLNYDPTIQIFYEDGSTTGHYNDDAGSACASNSNAAMLSNVVLPKGKYYVVVDGYNGGLGNFALDITTQPIGAKVSAEAMAVLEGKALRRELLLAGDEVIAGYRSAVAKSGDASRMTMVDLAAMEKAPVRGSDLAGIEKAANGGRISQGESGYHGVQDPAASMAYEARKASRVSQGLHPQFSFTMGSLQSPSLVLELPAKGKVRIALFEILGKETAVLADGEFEAGRHMIPMGPLKGAQGVRVLRLRSVFGNLDRTIAPF